MDDGRAIKVSVPKLECSRESTANMFDNTKHQYFYPTTIISPRSIIPSAMWMSSDA